jgi:hypothetical protein
MSEAKIFLLGDGDDNLVPMTATPYATEDVLQALLARVTNASGVWLWKHFYL